jgi:flagellar motor switch/type III secretory pathway protein FliN
MSGAAPAAIIPSAAAEKAAASLEQDHEEARWLPVLGLPCQLAVELPLRNFRVADFLQLRSGSVIATAWRVNHDVPLRVNGTLIGWGEFDGSGARLAVRLTELA